MTGPHPDVSGLQPEARSIDARAAALRAPVEVLDVAAGWYGETWPAAGAVMPGYREPAASTPTRKR